MATTIPLSELPERYSFLDPAGGQSVGMKRRRARSAIVTIALDAIGRVFVIQAWAAHAKTDEIVEKVFEINEKFRPTRFGIESSGQQSLFADSVQAEAAKRDIKLPIAKVSQPVNMHKDFRIRTLIQPVLSEGRLFIQELEPELKSELSKFPTGEYKDLVDALASAIHLAPPRIRTKEGKDKSTVDADLERYLKSRGAPEHYIRQRCKGVNPRYAAA